MWNGYHSVPLHLDNCYLTTFITPGVATTTAPPLKVTVHLVMATQLVMTRLFLIFPQKTKCADDTLQWSHSIEESFWQAVKWLNICGHNGIILNTDKLAFAGDTVEFAGFQIGPDSVSPCPRNLKSILDFPTPKNIIDVCSWFGPLNQVVLFELYNEFFARSSVCVISKSRDNSSLV